MIEYNHQRSRFIESALQLCNKARSRQPDALVLIGGNAENSDLRQKEIFDVVNDLHRQGQRAYWYKAPGNATLDIPDQVIPGQAYVIIDLEVMSSSDLIQN